MIYPYKIGLCQIYLWIIFKSVYISHTMFRIIKTLPVRSRCLKDYIIQRKSHYTFFVYLFLSWIGQYNVTNCHCEIFMAITNVRVKHYLIPPQIKQTEMTFTNTAG